MIANNKETPKRIKVYSVAPLPESIRVLFDESKSHIFEVSMRNEFYNCTPLEDGNIGLTDCQAAIINPLLKINKETLDGPGKNLKVFISYLFCNKKKIIY